MVDVQKRKWLLAGTAVAGAALLGGGAYSIVRYLGLSEKTIAIGEPVNVKIADLKPGQIMTTSWRRWPIWILHRTPEMLNSLTNSRLVDALRDPESQVLEQQPDYARNTYRSLKPEIFVAVGLCTHLGCVPQFLPRPDNTTRANWLGGFHCPCHGSSFDLAGRVYKNVPAPINLKIPPHYYLDNGDIRIGANKPSST